VENKTKVKLWPTWNKIQLKDLPFRGALEEQEQEQELHQQVVDNKKTRNRQDKSEALVNLEQAVEIQPLGTSIFKWQQRK